MVAGASFWVNPAAKQQSAFRLAAIAFSIRRGHAPRATLTQTASSACCSSSQAPAVDGLTHARPSGHQHVPLAQAASQWRTALRPELINDLI